MRDRQIGTPTASVSQQVADVQRLMQKSGLSYSMHSAGTTVGKRCLKTHPMLSVVDGVNRQSVKGLHVDDVDGGGSAS